MSAVVQHTCVNYTLPSHFICPICCKHVTSMIGTHIENLMAIHQQGMLRVKKGQDLTNFFTVFLMILMILA